MTTNAAPELAIVDINTIVSEDRYRKDYGDITALAASLTKFGFISPIAVCQEGEKFRLLAGGRRFAAALEAKIPFVPIRIYSGELTEKERLDIELEENIQRKELTWQEDVALRERTHNLGLKHHALSKPGPGSPSWTMADSAKLLGCSTGALCEDIQLAKAMKNDPELAHARSKGEAKKIVASREEALLKAEIAKRLESEKPKNEAFKKNLHKNYILGDCLELMKNLPDQSADFFEIDPPYGVNIGDFSDAIEGFSDKPEDAMPLLRATLAEAYRILKENRYIVVWFSTRYFFDETFNALVSAGFHVHELPAIWVKTNYAASNPSPMKQLSGIYETFFYAWKGDPCLSRRRGNVFYAPSPASRIHPCEKPVELCASILDTFTELGHLTVVPFAGSGNTILAAAQNGRSAIGFDLSKTYRDSFITRLAQTS